MLEEARPTETTRIAAEAGSAWWRLPLGLLSPAGTAARLSILIFHRVHARRDPLFPGEIDGQTFRTRLAWLGNWFNVVSLEEGVSALSRGSLPARALAITFDDGYADNAKVALPILREHGLTATFFIATGQLDGGLMWNDTVIEAVRRAPGPTLDLASIGFGSVEIATSEQRRAVIDSLLRSLKHLPPRERAERVETVRKTVGAELPRNLMMSRADVLSLAAAGMGIGAHTVNHPILASVDDAEARREIGESRDTLEGLLRSPVRLFAYPNGKPNQDYRARDVAITRSLGFAAAFSTAPGAARAGDSLHELPRFTPWDRTRARWGVRLARNYLTRVEQAAA